MGKNTGKVREKSGNFVSPEKGTMTGNTVIRYPYASCWNAFLFFFISKLKNELNRSNR